ncbi:MAG: DMT family transporter [Deltaproteobacteria bacterium]|nr:DMT family transporter [Deltaproteobacteria bacterium]
MARRLSNSAVIALVLLLTALWGGSDSVAAAVVDPRSAAYIPPAALTFIRFLVAAMIIVPFAVRARSVPRTWGDVARVVLFAVTGFSVNLHLGYAGLPDSSASHSVLIRGFEPVLIAVNAAIFLRERITPAVVVAATLGFGGIFLIMDPVRVLSGRWQVGDLLIFLSVAVESGCSIVGRSLLKRYSALTITAWGLVVGSVISLPVAWSDLPKVPWSGATLFALFYLGVVCTAAGYMVWFVALERFQASRLAVSIFLQPVFGVAIAVGLRGEEPHVSALLGGAMVLFGAVTVVVSEWRRAIAERA